MGHLGHVAILIAAMLPSASTAAEIFDFASVTVRAVGGYCDNRRGEFVDAPHASGGKIERDLSGFQYVIRRDRLAAQPWLGIGIRVRVDSLTPGESVTEWIEYPDGDVAYWDARLDDDRSAEFGAVPPPGEMLPQGEYRLSLVKNGDLLFTYLITVQGTSDDGLCLPEVS